MNFIPDEWFKPGSGFRWCESAHQYQIVSYVAEFANTVSNLPLIVLPLVNIVMLRKYIANVNPMLIVPQLLTTTTGLASAYYHATTNLFGQLIDELSILWLFNSYVFTFLPIFKNLPPKIARHLTSVRLTILLATLAFSFLGFLKPSVNAFALMLFSIPNFMLIYYEGARSVNKAASWMGWYILVLYVVACTFWCADRGLCEVWLRLGVPYLHAAFHVVTGVGVYMISIMFSLLDIEGRRSRHSFRPVVRFFPSQLGAFGFPYILFTSHSVHA